MRRYSSILLAAQTNSKRSSVQGGPRGRVQGVRTPTPPDMTRGFLRQLVFTSSHQSVSPFLSGAPRPKKKSWILPSCG